MKAFGLSIIACGLGAAILAGCVAVPDMAEPQARFFARLQALCGNAYEGRLVTTDAADRDLRENRLVMYVRDCSSDEIRIPFHVGEDRSRTWVITRTPASLTLKHDHRHEDGSPDALSDYGGTTASTGTARRQEFPADAFSRELFTRRNIPQSAANIWAIEVAPGELFAYELRRPNRHVRVEFDLTRPVTAPAR